ncbi:AN1-type zinc finger protein [Apiospora arundinis]
MSNERATASGSPGKVHITEEPLIVDATLPTPLIASSLSKGDASSIKIEEASPTAEDISSDYNALTHRQRATLLFFASCAATISPASSTTYFPAVTSLARDLQVSVSLINLTISVYQIFQGLAPLSHGRLLRSICGSSGTVALAQAVLDDVTTSEQRGKYMAYLSIGFIMGPALGPVIGGLLSQYLGWRGIFWFLLIFGGVLMVLVTILFPETNRSIVGDGSNPPQRWNRSFLQLIKKGRMAPNPNSIEKKVTGVNPFKSLRILADRENLILCFYGGLLFAGFSATTGVFASQLDERYHLNQVQAGLCYLPLGFGSILSRWTVGKLIDWNFKREAQKQGVTIVKNRKQDMSMHDVEKVRLLIAFPMILAMSGFLVAFGWLMQYCAHLAAVLVVGFLFANMLTGALVATSALLTDINVGNGASLGAAMNLVRCLMAAGGVAAITPMINRIGIGYAATLMAAIWILALPPLWLVYKRGYQWRKASLDEVKGGEVLS